jgi:putative phage-type endonuclease
MQFLNLKQNTEEWEQFRKGKIGASDAPIITGVSPWKTPYQLWLEKTGQSTNTQNQAMKRGHTVEETARQAFEKSMGLVVFPRVVQSLEYDWMIASLDGIDLNGKILVEIKCAGKEDHTEAKQGKIPLKYYPQLQHQLATTGLEMGYYYSFDGAEGVVLEITRDSKYIKDLIEAEQQFVENIKTQTAPPLSSKDYRYRDDIAWSELSQRWVQKKEHLEALTQEEKILRDELIEMANHQNSYGGGVRLTVASRKGAVDYRSIPCLREVDLENYRKPSFKVWTVSKT